MRSGRSAAVGTLCAAMLAVLAGCGSAPVSGAAHKAASGGGTPAAKTASSPAASRAAGHKGRLVIYAAEGYDQAMATAFQKATGIAVKLDDLSTGPLVAKIEAEKNNPQWDVAWFDGDGTMQTLDQAGLLLQHWQPANAANYTRIGKALQSPDGSYIPTGVTAAGAIAYNTKLVPAADVPKNWNDLLKPFFKNGVGMDNPAISGPTYPVVAGLFHLYGNSGGQRYFEALKANGLKVFPTNKPTLQALSTGQIKVAIAQDSAEIQAMQQGAPIKIVYPSSGVTMLPGVLGIAKNAPDLAAAKKFANFVLSPQGQKVMLTKGGGDSNFNPIIKGEKPNAVRQQTGIQWNLVPVRWQGTNYSKIQTWFKDTIAG